MDRPNEARDALLGVEYFALPRPFGWPAAIGRVLDFDLRSHLKLGISGNVCQRRGSLVSPVDCRFQFGFKTVGS